MKKPSLLKNQQGFTFLEIVVVITIMGFLVSMTIPAVGHISKVQKIRATEQKLEEIKTAIIGKQDVFDERGLPVVKGYVGDMGELPKLYQSRIDEDTGKWKWTVTGTRNGKDVEVVNTTNDGTGHPIGLWTKNWGNSEQGALPEEKEDLGDKWNGPYITYPKTMYPDAVKNLDFTKDEDKDLYEQKQTEGKLIDAWGRILYFVKEYGEYETKKDADNNDIKVGIESTATLLIISQGPDGEIDIPTGAKYSSVAEEAKNKDNIVVKITPNEWYKAYNEGKEQEAKEQLEEIRYALIGSFKATDESGRKKIGGYIGDIGKWPALYKYDEVTKIWTQLSDYINDSGQPVTLWKDKLTEDEGKSLWKGPYIPAPWDKQLKDLWGNPIEFKLDYSPEQAKVMTITSAGIDGKVGTKDDISITINLNEWKNESIAINDEKKIKETKKILEDIRTALLGAENSRDATGRRIVGGYLSDMGKWPALYNYDKEKNEWIETSETETNKIAQPIKLWTKEGANISKGFGWRGTYLSNPYNKPLKDAWGNPIKFELGTIDGKETMTITSAGINGTFYEAKPEEIDDDIKIKIEEEDWRIKMTLKGVIYNNKNANTDPVTVTLKLFSSLNDNNEVIDITKDIEISPVKVKEEHIRNAENDIVATSRIITGGGKTEFTLDLDGVPQEVVLGLRKLKVTGGGLDEEIDIFIGEGGTQSPSSDKLNFFISSQSYKKY